MVVVVVGSANNQNLETFVEKKETTQCLNMMYNGLLYFFLTIEFTHLARDGFL